MTQNSQVFRIRRWLHGASAFISSIMSQTSPKTKLVILTLGFGIFSTWSLYYLTINDLIGGFVLDWTAKSLPFVLFLFAIAIYGYDYLKNRDHRKSHPIESISPILRSWGIVIGVIGGAIVVTSYFLTLLNYYVLELSTIPFI